MLLVLLTIQAVSLRLSSWNSTRGADERKPRNVYLDIGANWANTLRLYIDIVSHYSLHVHEAPWEVYAFEASPYIQPYVEAFVEHLNSGSPTPCLTVPPAGSMWTLAEYAFIFGCCAHSQRVDTWKAYIKGPGSRCKYKCCPFLNKSPDALFFDACLFKLFEKPINELVSSTVLNNSALVTRRMSEAARAPSRAPGEARYTFVPAAAGAESGVQLLQGVSRPQMLHGGGASGTHPEHEEINMIVQRADIPGFLGKNFVKKDLVIVKIDAEGVEYPILRKLITEKTIILIDVLIMECHGWAKSTSPVAKDTCNKLEKAALKAHPKL